MKVFIIIGIIAALICVIVTVILIRVKKDEEKEYYDAAQNIIKESKLNVTIKNPYNANSQADEDHIKPMIYLKVKSKKGAKYVFDPKTPINIGRDREKNQICINEAIVSHNHCCVFANGRHVYLKDCNSVNGIMLKRGMKKYQLQGGASTEIFDADTIKIGTTLLKVKIFYFDVLYM